MLLYRFFQYFGQLILVLFFGYRAFGRRNIPRTGPVIIASTHQSFMDPLLIGVSLPRPMQSMARASLFRIWGFGWMIRTVNAFPVERGSADLAAMREAIRRLKAGGELLVFPEGTRTYDGSIAPLQPGLAVLAARSGAAVVPVVIDGAYECWPRSHKLLRPGKIQVVFGQPIHYGGHGSGDAEAFMTELHNRMLALQAGLKEGNIQAQSMEP